MFCIVVCLFVVFLLVIVLSVLLRFTDSDYPFGIFKLFLHYIFIDGLVSFWSTSVLLCFYLFNSNFVILCYFMYMNYVCNTVLNVYVPNWSFIITINVL
jgi:hypothetical protein